MLITEDKEIDIFVASRIGSFKHIKYHTDSSQNNKKCIENLVNIKSLQKDDTITTMVWGNVEQTEILIGKRNQQIQTYNTEQGFTNTYTADFGTGDVVGLGRCKRKLLAAVASGVVKVWGKTESVVETGKIDRMRVCADDPTLFATGGEENDLKIWRIGESTPVFIAKNLPHDWLQLRRPIWVSDLGFLSEHLVAVCSRHGYVRLYDQRAQRRPVQCVDFEGMAATCMNPGFDERRVIVGFGRGQLHQVDLRVGKPDKGYKGSAGAITSVAVCPQHRLLISTSLDRHLRVHQHSTKELVYKQYLTSKLSCALVQSASSTPLGNAQPDVKEEIEEGDDMDALFEGMKTVGDEPKKHLEEIEAKRMKPSTEGSTQPDDPIARLLKSTERQKRRMEKRKREKKAKSLFHNA